MCRSASCRPTSRCICSGNGPARFAIPVARRMLRLLLLFDGICRSTFCLLDVLGHEWSARNCTSHDVLVLAP